MSELKRKLNAIRNVFTTKPQYKKFHNYDPKNPFPAPGQTYKKFKQPKPQSGKGKRKRRKKLIGGRRKRKQSGGRRRQRGRGKFIKEEKIAMNEK